MVPADRAPRLSHHIVPTVPDDATAGDPGFLLASGLTPEVEAQKGSVWEASPILGASSHFCNQEINTSILGNKTRISALSRTLFIQGHILACFYIEKYEPCSVLKLDEPRGNCASLLTPEGTKMGLVKPELFFHFSISFPLFLIESQLSILLQITTLSSPKCGYVPAYKAVNNPLLCYKGVVSGPCLSNLGKPTTPSCNFLVLLGMNT